MERLVIVGNEPTITAEQVGYIMDASSPDFVDAHAVNPTSSLKDAVDALERQMITDALSTYKSTYKAADALGTSQSTIVRKMRLLGISKEE